MSDKTNTHVYGVDLYGRLFELPPEPEHPLLAVLTRGVEALERIATAVDAMVPKPITYEVQVHNPIGGRPEQTIRQLHAQLMRTAAPTPEPEVVFVSAPDLAFDVPDIDWELSDKHPGASALGLYPLKLEKVVELGEFRPVEVEDLEADGVFIKCDDYWHSHDLYARHLVQDPQSPYGNQLYGSSTSNLLTSDGFHKLNEDGLKLLGLIA